MEPVIRRVLALAVLVSGLCAHLAEADARPRRSRRFLAYLMPRLTTQQVPVIMWVSASYGDPASTQGPAFYTSTQRCSDDASVCAYRYEDGGIVAAAEDPANTCSGTPCITPQIGAIQGLGRELDRPVLLIDSAFAGQRVSNYNLTDILAGLDAAAAWAAANGLEICPVMLSDNSGGYNENNAGDPFSTYTTDLEAHETTIETRIAARVAAGTAGWAATCTNVSLMMNGGGAQGFGSGVPVRHDYADDFVTYVGASDDRDLCGQFYFMEVGADNLHPSQAGGIALADAYARCWARKLRDGFNRAAVLTAVSVVDADTITATFQIPCRFHGGCVNEPPVTLNTTDVVAQTSDGVVTYGFHFYLSGVLQTPGAVSSVTYASCPAPATTCDVTIDFASLPDFDEVAYAETAVGLGPAVAAGGGGNFLVETTDVCGADTPCADYTVHNVLPVNSFDAGPDAGFVDSGPADSGVVADAGFPDSGVVDSGPADAGFPDSGVTPDAGPDAGSLNNNGFGDPGTGGSWTVASALPFDSFCHGGWAAVPPSFGAWANQWQGAAGGTDRWWHGNNPNETAPECNALGRCMLYAINGTARVHATQPAVGTQHFWFGCYDTGGPSQNVWLDGVLDNGALTAAVPSSAPANTTLEISQNFHGDATDEVVWFGWTGSGTLTTAQVVDIMCATLPPNLRASPPAVCSGLTVNLSDVYNIAGFQEHCSFEGGPSCYNGTTLTEVSSPAYGTYADAGVP